MNSKDNEFDRWMREKLHGFTPDAPADLWHKIEARLAAHTRGDDTMAAPRRPRRKPSGWWMAAAAVLIVTALAFWFSRPAEVIYLQGKATKPDGVPVVQPAPQPAEAPPADAAPNTTPLSASAAPARAPKADQPLVEASDGGPVRAFVTGHPETDRQLPAADREIEAIPPVADTLKTYLVEVPEVQPPVMLDDMEDVMLADAASPENTFGAGRLLNWVVGAVDQRTEKAVTFSNDREGSLKVDFNFNLARNRKKR